MSKYTVVNELITQLIEQGDALGLDREEMLSTLIIVAVDDMQRSVGRDQTRVLLTYELDNMGGSLDMVNLRAR